MKRHPAVLAGLFAAFLILSAVPAEAGKARFHFSFGFGAGPHYAYGHAGFYRGFAPRVYGSYVYRTWYRPPVVRYSHAPYRYRVYQRYVPRAREYAPAYGQYAPRRYVRPVRRY